MAFRHQLGTKPIGKRLLLLPEPRPGPSAEPKIICHPEAGNTKYIPLSEEGPPHRRRSTTTGPSQAPGSSTWMPSGEEVETRIIITPPME